MNTNSTRQNIMVIASRVTMPPTRHAGAFRDVRDLLHCGNLSYH